MGQVGATWGLQSLIWLGVGSVGPWGLTLADGGWAEASWGLGA